MTTNETIFQDCVPLEVEKSNRSSDAMFFPFEGKKPKKRRWRLALRSPFVLYYGNRGDRYYWNDY